MLNACCNSGAVVALKLGQQQGKTPSPLPRHSSTRTCAQAAWRLSHGCGQAGAAGGQRGQRDRLPEAGAPGHADRAAGGDHAPEEAVSR